MKKGWTTTKLIAIGGLAALNVTIQLIASILTLTSDVMMASGVITSFVGPVLVVLSLLLINRFGSGFIFLTITGILDIPLAIAGPPGFLPKALLYVCLGIIVELTYFYLKRYNKIAAVAVVGGIEDVFITLSVIAVARLFNVPGVESIAKFVSTPMIAALFLVGCLSGYLGYLSYQKIKDTAVVKRIQL